jgi:DNA-binding winged helix-turn-helix (wHTH) protein
MLAPSLFRGMSENSQSVSAVIRFGPFDADLQTQELRKHGVRLRLPRQSFQILKMLLERPGSLIAREELRQVLWPSDTFVDFDHGLNAAVNRLREALGDSADEPRLVETLPRRGYRFIGEIALPTTAPEPLVPRRPRPCLPPPRSCQAQILAGLGPGLALHFSQQRFASPWRRLSFCDGGIVPNLHPPPPFRSQRSSGGQVFPLSLQTDRASLLLGSKHQGITRRTLTSMLKGSGVKTCCG